MVTRRGTRYDNGVMRVVPQISKRRSSRQQGASSLRSRLAAVVAVLVALTTALALGAMAMWPPLDEVVAGQTAAYPDLHPVDYRFSSDRVFSGVLEVLGATPGVTVTSSDAATGTVVAVCTRWPRALSVEIAAEVAPNGAAGSVVFARSRLLSGRADFGQNARVLRAFYAELDENLALARPD